MADPVTSNKIDLQVGFPTDIANALGTLHAKFADLISNKLTTLFSAQGNSVVKSIQRGVNAGGTSGDITITISSVNANKCSLILQPSYGSYSGSGGGDTMNPYLKTLTGTSCTSFVVGQSSYYTGGATLAMPFSWQLIEYY
jgi:hypothetical protein